MAMQVGPSSGEDEVVAQINTTPLVDVMLVLLIIFLITIPVVTTAIPLKLPKERVEERETKPDNIILSVNPQGQIFWHDTPIANTRQLIDKLKTASIKASSTQKPQPEVQIRGDMTSTYAGVGKIMYACQIAGIAKVAFITEPPPL